MKKSLKGFTLMELIIVLALFSIIMFSVVQLLDPVTKFYVRSSNFESTTACIDNMKRSIEGNLKYVDRIRGYAYYKPYDGDYVDQPDVSDDLKGHLTSFYNYFFANRKATDSAGFIYVLAFDNTRVSAPALAGPTYQVVSDFTDQKRNSGQMILYKFWFNNYDPAYDTADEMINSAYDMTSTPPKPLAKNTIAISSSSFPWIPVSSVEAGITDWYVNQKLYGNFEYRFDLVDDAGKVADEFTTLASFNPASFNIAISLTELRTNRDAQGLIRIPSSERAVSSFSMKNVLDVNSTTPKTSFDYYLTTPDETVSGFTYTSTPKNRYKGLTVNDLGAVYNSTEEKWEFDFDGFYFIFTLPETTYTHGTNIGNQG